MILLQPVDGTRVYGTERRRNRLYERIRGMDAYRNIVVATTMTNTFSKGLNHQSFGILWSRAVLSQQARPLQLQKELVGNGYDLSTTSVRIQLITDIKAMIFRDTSRITELEEDLRRTAADNAAMRARLEGDLNDLIEKLKKAEDDIERLKQRRVSFARISLSTY